jgi:hypothetical protein
MWVGWWVGWWVVVQLTTLSLPTRVEVELGCDNNKWLRINSGKR